MLPIGYLGPHPGEGEARESMFTHDEVKTLLTLWSIFRSPLMIGANLPKSDSVTLQLLTNPEIIAVDQHSISNHLVVTDGQEVVWTAQSEDAAGYYVAVFNISGEARTFQHSWKDLGFSRKSYEVRDLWQRRELGRADRLQVTVAPHAATLYQITVE
jgi:hypothetical protein